MRGRFSDLQKNVRAEVEFSFIQDRLTVQEREKEEARERQAEREAAILAEQRKRETHKLVEHLVKLDGVERKAKDNDPQGD